MKQGVIIFTKNLLYGQVKTRLAASIGNEAALTVYKTLVQHTATITNDLPVDKTVFYSDSLEKQDIWNNEIYHKQVQCEGDLGKRMHNAFITAFEEGLNEVVIIGTDCVELTAAIIMDAFSNLHRYDIVLGPSKDGGYYLLGMKNVHYQLFQNIHWSTDKVLQQTLAVCELLSLSVFLLPELSDLDEEKDLYHLQNQLLQYSEHEK